MPNELERIEAEIVECEKKYRRTEARFAELRDQGRKLIKDRDRARLKSYVGKQVKYRFQGENLSGVALTLIKVNRTRAVCEEPSGKKWTIPIDYVIPTTESCEPAICKMLA